MWILIMGSWIGYSLSSISPSYIGKTLRGIERKHGNRNKGAVSPEVELKNVYKKRELQKLSSMSAFFIASFLLSPYVFN